MNRKGIAFIALAAVAALASVSAASAKRTAAPITGAGSSLVAPLVSQWVAPVGSALGSTLTYGSVGSGAGIAQITARTVDFGASDAPLTPDQLAACNAGGAGTCVQIPWALSATTVSYNIPGVPNDLKLTDAVVAKIFLGQITNWNNPAIQKTNPKVKMPNLPIHVVYRSDGSGDTYAFTDFLSRVSPAFKAKVGNATQVSWPVGVGGKGNSGVAGIVSNQAGAVGYISVAYVLQNHLHLAAIQNAYGVFQTPGIRAIAAAARAVTKVPANNEMHIVDPPKGKGLFARHAYPISTFTYIIVPTSSPKATDLRHFIFWAVTHGQEKQYTAKLVFAPIPKVVLVAAERTLNKIQAT